MQAVYGYRIYTETTENSNAIGLYSGQIRWLESELAGLAEPWKTILVSGVSAATDDGLDTRLGGGVAEVGGFDLVVDNTSQIAQRLDTLGIVLTGKRCEKIRIDPSNMREYVEFTGYCEDVKWNEREMQIPVKDCRLKRDAVLATVISTENRPNASSEIIGGVIPVTYGEIDKAKMVRTANKKTNWENPAYGHYKSVSLPFGFAYTIIGSPTYPYGLSVFPVVGKGVTPTREYKIQLAGSDTSIQWTKNGAPFTSGTVWLSELNGKYLYVVSGDGSGQYRRIEVAWCNLSVPTAAKPVTVIVNDYFKEEPIGNLTGDEKTNVDGENGSNSWVQIVDIEREYEADISELKNFTDEDGTVITAPDALGLFSFDSPKSVNVATLNTSVSVMQKPVGFFKLPEYAYTEAAAALKNAITIDAKLFDDNPDQMNSFTILPVSGLETVKNSSLAFFDAAGETYWKKFIPATNTHALIGGYYRKDNTSAPAYLRGTLSVSGALADVIDKNQATYFQHKNHWDASTEISQDGTYARAIRLILPRLAGVFEWDSCYMMVDAEWAPDIRNAGPIYPIFTIRYRRFLGPAIQCFEDGDSNPSFNVYGIPGLTDPSRMKNAPDFYYDADIDKNLAFYWETGREDIRRYGFSKFLLTGIQSDDDFNSIADVTIVTKTGKDVMGALNTPAHDDNFKLYEAGILFRKSVSIQDAIYTGIRGRIRGTAWRAGRPATDLLDDPIDIAEDLLRRQNWSETGDTETPGIEQAPHAKINIKTTHGGFEAPSLDTPRGMVAARQVLEYDASRTSKLLNSLCREFFLIQYRESNGSECITYFPERDSEPSIRRITLSDVPAGVDIPDVQAPSPSDVFCYDINLRYKRNYASVSFDGLLSITHTDAATYDPAYVTGYDGGYKQAIWERAHQLYVKYRRQEKPPAELVELEWHRTVDGAAWYIRNLLNWSDKQRLTLPVLDEVARKVPKFSRITLNLPHHTDGSDVACFVERVKRNSKSGVSELSLVFYDDVDWTSGGVSLSDSSASDSASSSSDVSASDSSSSFSGLSKSSSSSSGSESSDSSGSSDSVSSSSGVLVTDDHRHTKIMNPTNENAGLEIIPGNEIEVGAFLKQLPDGTGQGISAQFVIINANYPIQRLAVANGPQARWMLDAQAHDLDLTAISALSGTGIACRTAADTWATRNLVSGNTGIVVTNPAGVAANPTITLNASLINGSIVDSLHHHSVLYRSSDGAAALTVNAAGNVGISVAASAWHADDIGIDIGAYAGISSFNWPGIRLSTNIYRNSVGNWIVKTNGKSSLFYAEEDAFYFQVDGPMAKLSGATATLTTMLAIGTGGVMVNNLADADVGYVKSSKVGHLSRQTGVPWADVTGTPITDTSHYTGFINRTDTSLAFVAGAGGTTRTLTLTCAGKTVWIAGVKYTLAADLTKQIADVTGLYWFWITAPLGVPQLNGSTDALNIGDGGANAGFDQCLVATVYWNTTTDLGILSDERHWAGRDCWMHEYLHETVNARWYTGGTITPTDTTFSISQCEFYDEDIEHVLALSTVCRVLYHNGSAAWAWDDNSVTPYKLNGTAMRYNNGTALADCGTGDHLCMWMYATNNVTYPFMAVMGDGKDNTIAAARLRTPPSFGSLTSAEVKLLYKLIYRQNASSVTYMEAADYRTSTTVGSTYSPTDHSVLSNLGYSASGHTGFQPAAHGGTTGTIVKFGVNSLVDSLIVENATGIGFGTAASYFLHGKKDQDAPTQMRIENATNGASSRSIIGCRYNSEHETTLQQFSPLMEMTYGGLNAKGMGALHSENDNGLIIANVSPTPLYLTTNNVVALKIDASQVLWIGSTFDTNLYRSGANVLKTDDAFQAAELACGCAPAGFGVDSESALLTGYTYGKFGASKPIYLIADAPHVGFNAYYYGGYKFGKGSSDSYAGVMMFNPSTGDYTLQSTSATGNANATATMTTRLTVDVAGVLTPAGGLNLGDTTLTKYVEDTFTMKCYLASDDSDLTTPSDGLACTYVIVGKHCIVTIPATAAALVYLGNINANVYMGNFPAEIDPASCKIVPIFYSLDGSNRSAGYLGRYAAGKWILLKSDLTRQALPAMGANNLEISMRGNQAASDAKVQMIYSLD